MGIGVIKAEFDLLWAKIEEADLETPFLKYLAEQYELYDFDRAAEIVREEGVFR